LVIVTLEKISARKSGFKLHAKKKLCQKNLKKSGFFSPLKNGKKKNRGKNIFWLSLTLV